MVAEVESALWWRTYLLIDVASDDTVRPALLNASTRETIDSFFDAESLAEYRPCAQGLRRWKINIAVAQPRALLAEGEWVLVDRCSGRPLSVGDGVLEGLEDLNRSFSFAKGRQLYSVRFSVPANDTAAPQLRMHVAYYRRDGHPRRSLTVSSLAKKCLGLTYRAMRLFARRNGKRILFMTENGNKLSGNLAAIDARMRERGLQDEFEISHSARNIFAGRLRPLEWMRVLWTVARHDIIFVEDYVPIFAAIDLPPDVKLVQVWHAGFGFKAVGFGRFGIDGSPNPFASCHRKYTYALVGNADLREIYSEVFGIERSALLATGMPRLDHFLDDAYADETRQRFRSLFPEAHGRRVIVFAPTYRGANQREAHYDFSRVDFGALHTLCRQTDSVVVFKMHRFIREAVPIPDEFRDRFVDASGEDINVLFHSADVLVTDYSSCFYDYLLLGKPVVFYCYDLALYSATRGIHRRVEDVAPGPVCKTFEELLGELARPRLNTVRPDGMLVDRAASRPKLSASDAVIDFVVLEKEVPGICLD